MEDYYQKKNKKRVVAMMLGIGHDDDKIKK